LEILIGISLKKWRKLLKQNPDARSLKYFSLILKTTILSIFRNNRFERKERKEFGSQIQHTEIKPPVFILGHWRSGTSYLHRLLSLDDHFTYPTVFDIYSPHSFLFTERMLRERLKKMAGQKRPMDQMEIRYDDPGEDEFALAVMSLCSPLLAWVFNNRTEFYDRYLTFDGVPPDELQEWKDQLNLLLKKLTVRANKPVMLKSPTHTARVGLLQQMYPQAKFIHIHRDPYTVFNSTVKLYDKTVRPMNLYPGYDSDREKEGIIARYKLMYERYFKDVHKLPDGTLIDISYEYLDRDATGTVKTIYEAMHLGDFEAYLPRLKAHLDKIGNYKKNNYATIEPKWRRKINQEWDISFKNWGYDKRDL